MQSVNLTVHRRHHRHSITTIIIIPSISIVAIIITIIITIIIAIIIIIITVFSRYSRYLVFCGRSETSNRGDIAIVMKKFWFGDWFILMQLCKEIHPVVFHEVVLELRDRLDPKRAENLEMR